MTMLCPIAANACWVLSSRVFLVFNSSAPAPIAPEVMRMISCLFLWSSAICLVSWVMIAVFKPINFSVRTLVPILMTIRLGMG